MPEPHALQQIFQLFLEEYQKVVHIEPSERPLFYFEMSLKTASSLQAKVAFLDSVEDIHVRIDPSVAWKIEDKPVYSKIFGRRKKSPTYFIPVVINDDLAFGKAIIRQSEKGKVQR